MSTDETYQNAACWIELCALLRQRGWRVITPALVACLAANVYNYGASPIELHSPYRDEPAGCGLTAGLPMSLRGERMQGHDGTAHGS